MAKRLAKERADLDANPDKEDRFCVESVNNDLEWTMVLLIDEAADCCYAGGIYTLKLIFPSEYPSKPPMIRFPPPHFTRTSYKKMVISRLNFWRSGAPPAT